MSNLQEIWSKLSSSYCKDETLVEKLWKEIEEAYSEKRFYHNLKHLKFMLHELRGCEGLIDNYDVVRFALFYHDIVYRAHKKDNEVRSAEIAEIRLRELGVNESDIQFCYNLIVATRNHEFSSNADVQYFLDADMAVLGVDREDYKAYMEGVRKEYSVYPDLLYNPGRKKMLYRFLDMPRIFQSDHFYQKYEEKAKENIEWEIKML